ncbi:MAG: host attachment protein [Alphaproteobacteria bacterium]
MPVKKIIIWIVVGDGGGYRMYSCLRMGGPLTLVTEATNPLADKRTREIGSDRPGRSQASPGQGRHALQNKVDWHTEAEKEFAKALGVLLSGRYREKAFDKLFLIAPAKILGEIRHHLPLKALAGNLSQLTKDLTHLKIHELRDYLKKEF